MTPKARRWIRLCMYALISILFISGFFVIVHEIIKENEAASDYAIMDYFRTNIISPALTPWMKFFTFMASGPVISANYIILLTYLYIKNKNDAFLKVFFIAVGSALLIYFSKIYYHRERPLEPLIDPLQTFSFPSGHSALGLVFYTMLCYMIWRSRASKEIKILVTVIVVILVPGIGISRVYLRAHFPSDVLGGFCEGAAWLVICYYFFRVERRKLYYAKLFKWMD